jgi:CRP/FNR family transcriptional regulator
MPKKNNLSCDRCTFSPFCQMAEQLALEKNNQKNLATKQLISLKKKELLSLPKHQFKNLYVIKKGALKSHIVAANGKEIIQGFYFSGEVLGFESIYTNQYLFSATALSDTQLCEIPYDVFLELLSSKPDLQKYLLFIFSRQLNIGTGLSTTSAEQQLSAFLIELATRLDWLDNNELYLPMSRSDMGNYLRLSAETISRVLSRLQKNKIILIHQKKICLLQKQKLKAIAEGLVII